MKNLFRKNEQMKFHEAGIRWNGYEPTERQIKKGECIGDLY
jgi:hypothetical protein